MRSGFDLLGDPIPENHGKPGANGHVATAENTKKVRTLLVAGVNLPRIAEELGISVPTLRRHYFANGKINVAQAREMARAEMEARVLLKLDQKVDEGNVSAMKEMRKIVEAKRLASVPKSPTPKAEPIGKKEARRVRAGDVPLSLEGLLPSEDTKH